MKVFICSLLAGAVLSAGIPVSAAPRLTVEWSDEKTANSPFCPEAAVDGAAFAQAYNSHSDSAIVSATLPLIQDLQACVARYQQQYINTDNSSLDPRREEDLVRLLDRDRMNQNAWAATSLPMAEAYIGNVALIAGNAYARTKNFAMARKSYAVVISLNNEARRALFAPLINAAKTQLATIPPT